MWTVEHHAGRLIEGRVHAFHDASDAARYCDRFRTLIASVKRNVIIVADYRPASVFDTAIADELKRLMIEMNPVIERSAIVVATDHATHALQVQRVVRESENASRRRFASANEAAAWLGEITSSVERSRLAAFLAEWPDSQRVA